MDVTFDRLVVAALLLIVACEIENSNLNRDNAN